MQEQIHKQYKDDANLNARIQLHKQFSTNPLPWQKWIFEQLDIPAQATILDLGCGPGTFWVENQGKIPAGWEITLTDFSEGMLEAAQKNLQDTGHTFRFRIVDAQDISFDDASFDAVIANHMLYHVPDRLQALSEIKRVIRPGGPLYATTVGEQQMVEMWALVHPFAPDLLWHRPHTIISGFTLENGAGQLTQFFCDVKRIDYDDNLEVTDAEAVIAYLRSTTTLNNLNMTDAMVTYIRERINAAITERGAFHVTKASGLFSATRQG